MSMILQNAIVGLRQSMAAGAASLSDSSIRSGVVLVVVVLVGGQEGVIVRSSSPCRRRRAGPVTGARRA